MSDKIAEIRARHLHMGVSTSSHWCEPKQMQQDIGTLLAEVERLREALAAIRVVPQSDAAHGIVQCLVDDALESGR